MSIHLSVCLFICQTCKILFNPFLENAKPKWYFQISFIRDSYKLLVNNFSTTAIVEHLKKNFAEKKKPDVPIFCFHAIYSFSSPSFPISCWSAIMRYFKLESCSLCWNPCGDNIACMTLLMKCVLSAVVSWLHYQQRISPSSLTSIVVGLLHFQTVCFSTKQCPQQQSVP